MTLKRYERKMTIKMPYIEGMTYDEMTFKIIITGYNNRATRYSEYKISIITCIETPTKVHMLDQDILSYKTVNAMLCSYDKIVKEYERKIRVTEI